MRGKRLWLLVDFTVNAGQVSDFQAVAKSMTEASENEPGTLVYDWFFAEDGLSCRLVEEYVDSAAVATHFAGPAVQELLPKLLQFGAAERFEVYGDPEPELARAAAEKGARIYSYWTGMNK
jgi:quinol monooxygenase YgiN